ncbi:MAG TPA: ATP-dependent DNA ligase [Candidatus Binataceae bacterium]|nr:ATP-dependent DNA ligase [Candidatus Binataceae bacterium]
MASFNDFALVCQALGQTSSRLQMAELAGEFLALLDVEEAEIAADFMVGRALAQGEEKRLQVSGRAIWRIVAAITGGAEQGEEIFAAATDFGEAIEILLRLRPTQPEPVLTIAEVARRFAAIAQIEGRNSRRRKLDELRELFAQATALEGKYLAKILIREMRHGMSEGLMLEAIARMAGRPVAEVRRAHMLEGDLGRVVRALRSPRASAAPALPPPPAGEAAPIPAANAEAGKESRTEGRSLAAAPSATARPMRPMLAAPAQNIAEAFRILGAPLALEHKLDGARVQIHCAGGAVRIFSRRLNEITQSLPEVVEAVGRLGDRQAVLDGEVIAVDSSGRPLAFQEVMRRFGRVREVERLRREQPIRLFLFDLMALDGSLTIDLPYEERYAALSRLAAPVDLELAGRILPASVAEGEGFYARAVASGYEGVMAKALASPYTPGVRGRGWLKIKHARTLDLVIVAADWGYGRRHGWLSNYHLAARDERTGEFVEIGKTFKGLTDSDFGEMTERLLALKVAEQHGTVFVRPEVVVEVAYSDIQRSPQYASGMALRFARIVGVRSDKGAQEADTIVTVATAFDRQLVKPLGAGG